MQDRETQLRELLGCYGSNVEQWPEASKPLWLEALRQPQLARIIEEEKRFERILAKRGVPEVPRDLTQRIISASLTRPQVFDGMGWFSDLMAEVRPSALAAMLVIGFTIGFGMVPHAPHALKDSASARTLTDDEGAIL